MTRTNYLYSENRRLKYLKDIPANKWDKVIITAPWDEVEEKEDGKRKISRKSLTSKILSAEKLVKEEKKEEKDVHLLTSEGLEKIKRFVDSSKELPVNDEVWAWSGNDKTLLGVILEDDCKILKDGKFVSKEAFDFMAWALDEQEIEFDYFDLENEIQRIEKEYADKIKDAEIRLRGEFEPQRLGDIRLDLDSQEAKERLERKSQKVSNRRLGSIPVEKWDKVTIITPWNLSFPEKGLSKKISLAGRLVINWTKRVDEGGYVDLTNFTPEGLERIKGFVDLDFEFYVSGNFKQGLKQLRSLTVDDHIDWRSNEDRKRLYLEIALEDNSKILKDGKFVSKEAFEFLSWALGDQEVGCRFFDREVEIQKNGRKVIAKSQARFWKWKPKGFRGVSKKRTRVK